MGLFDDEEDGLESTNRDVRVPVPSSYMGQNYNVHPIQPRSRDAKGSRDIREAVHKGRYIEESRGRKTPRRSPLREDIANARKQHREPPPEEPKRSVTPRKKEEGSRNDIRRLLRRNIQ